MKRVLFLFSVCLLGIGCGDDGDTGGEPDAAVVIENPGFAPPAATVTAWTNDSGAWSEVGPADFSCLNTPSDDVATTVDINLTGTLRDFQNQTPIANASVEMFAGIDYDNPLVTASGDADGNYTLVLPQGQTRYGYRISADGYLDTFLLNQQYSPDTVDQNRNVDAVSVTTANLLPAVIGIQRTDGLGVVAAAMRDCNGDTVKDAVATVSAASARVEHLDGGQTYYFNNSLPASLAVMQATNNDGLFVVLELPPTATGYLQVWGFTSGQDPTTDDMTLLAEIPAPVLGDTVITASVEPLRQ